MSLPTRIIFVSAMLACAALCAWAAVAFGGPGATVMWALTGGCILIAIVVWLIKARPPENLESIRVEGAPEPTFRLVRRDVGAAREIWQLVLGSSHCTLIRPDGTQATTFARKWADTAIRRPSFVSGELLGIVKEDWTPPDDTVGVTPGELFQAARTIRHVADRDIPCYWFSAPPDLLVEIDAYQRRTIVELGAEAAGPLRIKARRFVLSGGIGLVVGIGLLAYGAAALLGKGEAPADRRIRPIALGAVIALLGLWRLGQGFTVYRQAGRVSQY
jgi:hypothetical protein